MLYLYRVWTTKEIESNQTNCWNCVWIFPEAFLNPVIDQMCRNSFYSRGQFIIHSRQLDKRPWNIYSPDSAGELEVLHKPKSKCNVIK